MIKEACEKNFFNLEKKGKDHRKKYVVPTQGFIEEFGNYLTTLKSLSF